MHLKRVSWMFLLVGASVCACSAPQPDEVAADTPAVTPAATLDATLSGSLKFDFGQPVGMDRADYAAYLMVEAAKLAESELARLSAIELVYRNKLYYHSFYIPGTYNKGGAYVKMYREFTDYSIVDISHSVSILHPISVLVEFNYDIVATDPVLVDGEDIAGARTARNRANPNFFRRDSVRMYYPCDELGVPELPLPAQLARPNYWDKGEVQHEVFMLQEVLEVRSSGPPKTRKPRPNRRRAKS